MFHHLIIFIAGMLFMRMVRKFLKDIFERGIKRGKKIRK